MKQGAFTFVLHSHLPYCRQAGRWPHGEEWLHEAIAETYVPLLTTLCNLAESGIKPRVTLGITPVLADQLADPLVVEHFRVYAQDRADRSVSAAPVSVWTTDQGELDLRDGMRIARHALCRHAIGAC